MTQWASREERQAAARECYEHINTTPSPPDMGAYINAGVIGFVFGQAVGDVTVGLRGIPQQGNLVASASYELRHRIAEFVP